MATADHIINALGGSATISREERIPLTTIESWKAANFVPDWRQDTLLNRAKKRRIAITAADFPTPAERISRPSSRKPADVQAAA
jgi:hypothetical protein